MTEIALRCDGCGQTASPAHVAQRLQRLEWTTRYRPVHIGALLLGAIAPREDAECLYAPEGKFAGEAKRVLQATGVGVAGKSAEAVLSEFQRGGFLLAHVLECPRFQSANLNCAVVLDDGKPFALDRDGPEDGAERLHGALAASSVVGR